MRAADLDLMQQGYRRGYIAWERVRAAINSALPACTACHERPANAGGWRDGERLCAECAQQQLSAKEHGR